jgi:peptidoglycan/LPS O-acetylase OafA/YrhL
MRKLNYYNYIQLFFQKWFLRTSPKHPLSKQTYFPALTGVRAIAAYLVFFLHFNPFRPVEGHTEGSEFSSLFLIFNELHIGVSIFFVLSGFLICLRYVESFQLTKHWFVRYFQNRVARIYPMYFLLTTLTFAVNGFDVSLYLAHITFLRGFFDDLRFTGIGPGWSLTVEECFYFAAPFIFLFLRRRFPLYLQVLVWLGVGVGLVFISQKTGLSTLNGLMGSLKNTLLYTFFGRCIEFYIGIQLAIFFKKYTQQTVPKPLIPNGFYTAIGGTWMLGCVVGLAFLKTPDLAQGLLHPMGIFVNNAVLPVGVALFFWGLLTEHTFFRKVLETPFMELLGKSSYIFYLIHFGVISAFITEHITHHQLLPTFISLNIVAIVLFQTLEEPLNHRIRRLKMSYGLQSVTA